MSQIPFMTAAEEPKASQDEHERELIGKILQINKSGQFAKVTLKDGSVIEIGTLGCIMENATATVPSYIIEIKGKSGALCDKFELAESTFERREIVKFYEPTVVSGQLFYATRSNMTELNSTVLLSDIAKVESGSYLRYHLSPTLRQEAELIRDKSDPTPN